jgi:hypothetical protein
MAGKPIYSFICLSLMPLNGTRTFLCGTSTWKPKECITLYPQYRREAPIENCPSVNFLSSYFKQDGDRKVNVLDVVVVTTAYDATPADTRWNPLADLAAPWGKINVYDAVVVTRVYGKNWTP